MRAIRVCSVVALLISPLFAAAENRVPLVLEERTTLHVGEIAVLQMPSKRDYFVERTGGTLIEFKRQRQKRQRGAVLYRAVHPGDETIILAPADLADGHCVSCVTRHYFITVIP